MGENDRKDDVMTPIVEQYNLFSCDILCFFNGSPSVRRGDCKETFFFNLFLRIPINT